MLEVKTRRVPLSTSNVEIRAGEVNKCTINGVDHDVLSVTVDWNNDFISWTEWADDDLPKVE
jgi:hypothetical protein